MSYSHSYVAGICVCDKPLGAGVVVALGKGSSVSDGAGRGAAAALQTQQEAQKQTENQRDHQVALTVRHLQKNSSTVISLEKTSQFCTHTY